MPSRRVCRDYAVSPPIIFSCGYNWILETLLKNGEEKLKNCEMLQHTKIALKTTTTSTPKGTSR